MLSLRLVLLALIVMVAPVRAAEEAQIKWVGDWGEAFRVAGKTGKPVMICINSKDGEQANERAATGIYRDPWFVALSRRFVMVVVSTREHAADGTCPRFGSVTCSQHLDCWKDLRAAHGEEFLLPGTAAEMISPQHAWFAPDGTLLRRKEYELSRKELLKRMRAALAAVKKSGAAGGETAASGAPLDEREREALTRLERGDRAARRAALGTLFASEKTAALAALVDLAKGTRDDSLKCDLLRAFGQAQLVAARPAVEKLLRDKEAEVRSFAAVCLEDLGDRAAVPALVKRARSEPETIVRKNLCRALGACGGPAADKAAAKALLKAVDDDKQRIVRKHAALDLGNFAGAGAKLVSKRLGQLCAAEKDREVRNAIVGALAHVGDEKRTVRLLKKLLDETGDKWERSFMENAIKKLEGKEVRFSMSWLFWEDRDDPARQE